MIRLLRTEVLLGSGFRDRWRLGLGRARVRGIKFSAGVRDRFLVLSFSLVDRSLGSPAGRYEAGELDSAAVWIYDFIAVQVRYTGAEIQMYCTLLLPPGKAAPLTFSVYLVLGRIADRNC